MLPTILHCVSFEPIGRSIRARLRQVLRRRAFARPLTLAAVAVLIGCAASGQAETSPQPMALVDAYLIAHGMATSYAESETAAPAVVNQLARLDRKAAQAVQSMSQVQTGNEAATAAAISALAGYAARQSIIIQ